MNVRRKSLHRSANCKRAKKFANMRAAKERKRIERVNAPDVMPDVSRCYQPAKIKPLFVVTVRCRDGATVKMRIHEGPHGLTISGTDAGKRVAEIVKNYRPADAQAPSLATVYLKGAVCGVSSLQGRSANEL